MNTQLQITPTQAIRSLLEKQRDQISVAIPRALGLDAAKIIRVALSTINSSAKLQKCDPVSILGAVIQAAQLGLVVDGVLGHAYLVPFWNSKRETFEAKLLLGFRGLIQLAARGGKVSTISADVVYEGDKFSFRKGTDAMVEHVPTLITKNRGAVIAAYAVAKFADGSTQFEVMATEDIEAIRQGSKAADDSPWRDYWPEMARKTAVRKLAKYLPVNPDLVRAAVMDEYTEAGVTLNGDIETGEVTIPEVPAAAVDSAVAKVQEKVAEIKARPAEAPKPEIVKPEPAIYGVKGTLVRLTKKTSARGAPFLVLTVTGHTKGIFVYKADWHEHLEKAKGKKVDLTCKIDGGYNHLHAINWLGDQEFHEGVPVIQRGEVPPKAEVPPEQGEFNPTDSDIPF
jgi:recombination protein RecT